MNLVHSKISIEGEGGMFVFEGWVDTSTLWNGWDCPYFEFDVADEMCNTFGFLNDDEEMYYDEREDEFVVHNLYDDFIVETFPGEDIDGMHLYGIGNGSWCWEGSVPTSFSIVAQKPPTYGG